jgi:peptidyl-tRNA hydrolase
MAYEKLAKTNPELLSEWRYNGQPKVVVKTDSEASM